MVAVMLRFFFSCDWISWAMIFGCGMYPRTASRSWILVVKPFGKPASASSFLAATGSKAYQGSPTQPFGIAHGVK
jgi:hypothetical protein